MVIATTASTIAPITKAPMTAGFTRLPMLAPFCPAGEELPHARVGRACQELLRRARGDHRAAVSVEEDAVVRNREDAGKLVRDDHDGRAEALAQLEDQLVEPTGADRIEPGRRLVEEQHLRVERDRACQARALLHAATDLRRVVVLEPTEPDQRQLERGHVA